MSIDGRIWHERQGRGDGTARTPYLLHLPDAGQMARNLTDKYGTAALALARARAARAKEVGDHLALAAWQSVIEATRKLLNGIAKP